MFSNRETTRQLLSSDSLLSLYTVELLSTFVTGIYLYLLLVWVALTDDVTDKTRHMLATPLIRMTKRYHSICQAYVNRPKTLECVDEQQHLRVPSVFVLSHISSIVPSCWRAHHVRSGRVRPLATREDLDIVDGSKTLVHRWTVSDAR